MIAPVHYVVVVPKGKEYNQLVFHCITGGLVVTDSLTDKEITRDAYAPKNYGLDLRLPVHWK